mgnify:CR=1 FL=1|jgi:hypothetical protein
MITYERNMSFSLLRGVICTLAPLAFLFVVVWMYLVFAYDDTYLDAMRTASEEIRSWYRTYPVYILPAHFFVFLATVVYRRRIVNWWAQLVAITGLTFIALLGYYTFNPHKTPSLLKPQDSAAAPDQIKVPSGPPPRPNLLKGMHTSSEPSVSLQPDADGTFKVTARALRSNLVFTLEPRSDITTIAYERLQEFASLPCTPFQLPTGSGSVDACSMTVPELNVGGIRVLQANVVFVSTISGRSFLGRDLLTTIGYRRDNQSVKLGRS